MYINLRMFKGTNISSIYLLIEVNTEKKSVELLIIYVCIRLFDVCCDY